MSTDTEAGLFGIINSNRDFTNENSWGKNQFNSSFPTSLCCYLHSKQECANYLSITGGEFSCADISVEDVFGIAPEDKDTYFAFEAQHTPFQRYVVGVLPRTDLVVQNRNTGECLAGIEVKLTALPDNTTCTYTEDRYGSEIVVRPDSIVYLACSIAKGMGDSLKTYIDSSISPEDWTNPADVLPFTEQIINVLKRISVDLEGKQSPFLLQPVWKTLGKSPKLAEYCLDAFLWSDAGFLHFITQIANGQNTRINRPTRTAIWLYKMLLDIAENGRFDHKSIIDQLSYNTKNDKAFSSSGAVTNRFMESERLVRPVVKKDEIRDIILGGGQLLLSPERRFDAIIYNSPELFT